jgi:hypothetical protein
MCEEMNIVKLPKIGGRDSRLLTARHAMTHPPLDSNRSKKEAKAILFTLSSINESSTANNHHHHHHHHHHPQVTSGGSSGGSNNNKNSANNQKQLSHHKQQQQQQQGNNTSRFLTIN